jgi:arylsulfatase A-like enzyme/tetratricopeptide (TPR) repeat protein
MAPALASAAPSVLLITLDTTRADRLGVYGHTLAQTPNIDALAQRGTRFTRAYSTSPLTIPSHSTIFTGQVPPTHGVRDNGDFRLSDSAVTLAERFRDAGYQTSAFTAAFPTQAQWGFGQGFDTYHDALSALPANRDWRAQRLAEEVIDDALQTLADTSGPRFVWVHLFDAHWPYEPPEPFASQLQGRPYDGELAYVDHHLGRLLDWWADHEENSIVLLTADHGEALGEGGEQTHGFLLTDGTLRVPLLLSGPGVGVGQVIEDPVSHIDLAPTILALAGLPLHAGIQGRDLRTGGSDVAFSEALTGQFSLGLAPLTAFTNSEGRYVQGVWDSHAAFDGDRIPSNPPAGEYPEYARQLDALRDSFAPAQRVAAELDPQAIAQLMALGYMGSAGVPLTSDVDPRDVIDIIPLTWHARHALGAGRIEEAAAWIADLAEPLHGTYGLDLLRGQQLRASGDPLGAAQVLTALHDEAPSHDVALMLGGIHTDLADWQEAMRWFELALDRRGNSAPAMAGLVQSALALGLVQWAHELAEQFLDVFPDHLPLVLVRAELLLRQNRPQDALDETLWALQLSPWTPNAHAIHGRVLWELGRADEAIDAVWEALAWNPYDLGVRMKLVEMLLAVGRSAEAMRLMDQVEPLLPVQGPLHELWLHTHDAVDAERFDANLPPIPR